MFKIVKKPYYKMIGFFASKIDSINYDANKMFKLIEKEPSLFKLCDIGLFQNADFTNKILSLPNFDKMEFIRYLISNYENSENIISYIIRGTSISKDPEIMERLCRYDGRFFSLVSGSLANDKLYRIAKTARKNSFSFSAYPMTSIGLDEDSIRWLYSKSNSVIFELLRSNNCVPFDILKKELEKGNISGTQLRGLNLNYLNEEEMAELCKIDGRIFMSIGLDNITIEAYHNAISNSDPNKCFTNDCFKFMKGNICCKFDNDKFLEFCRENGHFFAFLTQNFDLKEAYKYATNNSVKANNFDISSLSRTQRLSNTLQRQLVEIDGRFFKYCRTIDLNLYRKAKQNGYDLKMGFDQPVYFANMGDMDEFVTLIMEEPNLLNHLNLNSFLDKKVLKNLVNTIIKRDVEFPLTVDLLSKLKAESRSSFNKLIKHYRKTIDKGEKVSISKLNLLFNYSSVNKKSSFYKYMKEKICEYYGIDANFLDYQISCGSRVNKSFASTLNPQILQDKYRILYEEKGHNAYDKLYIIGTFPDIQKLIVDIGREMPGESKGNSHRRIELLKLMLDKAIVNSEYKNVEEWIPNYSHIVNYFHKHPQMFIYFADHLDELDSDKIELLTSHALGYHNFPINSMEELNNYDEVRRNYIDKLYADESLGSVKEAFLEDYFGISPLIYKRLLMFKDGVLLAKDKYDEEIVSLFEKIDLIEGVKDPKRLLEARKKLVSIDLGRFNSTNNYRYLHLMLGIKENILKDYNNSLYHINFKDKPISYNECIFYKVAGEDGSRPFSLSITSLGAYSGDFDPLVRGFSFKDNWNMPSVSSHGICSSYLANNNMGTARVDYVILGFTNYEEGSLLTGGPYDLGSNRSNRNFDSFSSLSNSMFLHPKALIDCTRHTHNEYVFERRYKDVKRQPSYIVLDVDDLDKALKYYENFSRKGRYATRRMLRFNIENDSRSYEAKIADSVYFALKCAKDFHLPIVTIERDKICQNEWKKIVTNLKDFMEKKDFTEDDVREFLHSTLVEFENNAVGNTYHQNIKNKYFNVNNADLIVDTIKSKITVLMKDNPYLATVFLDELEKVCLDEENKMMLYRKNKSDSGIDFKWLRGYVIEQRKVMNMDVVTTRYITDLLEGNIGDNDCLMEYSSQVNFDDSNQLSISDVRSVFDNNSSLKTKLNLSINMIDTYKLYFNRDKSAHSRRHVEDVVLFSAVIGDSLDFDDRDMDILLASAVFHDAGRIDDRNVSHAVTSAILVKDKLIGVFSEDELKIIQSVIEFHEVRERKDKDGNIDYQPLYDICEKYGLDKTDEEMMQRCIKISNVLKDADALDRTRFVSKSKAFLNPRFLHYDISRRLFKVGEQLNEYYAKGDIEKTLEEKPELMDSFKLAVDITRSPKEAIRMYRKGKIEYRRNELESEVLGNGPRK